MTEQIQILWHRLQRISRDPKILWTALKVLLMYLGGNGRWVPRFLFLWGIEFGQQTSKTSESTASLSLAERWTITEICRQVNSVLTYSLHTDLLV